MDFDCPHCDQQLHANLIEEGTLFDCPHCGKSVSVPGNAPRVHRDEALAEEAIVFGFKMGWKFTKWFVPKAARIGINVTKRGAKAAASTPVGQTALQLANEAAEFITKKEEPPPPQGGPSIFVVLLIVVAAVGLFTFFVGPTSKVPPDSLSTSAEHVKQPAPHFSSVAEAKKSAVQRYPELGIAGSRFNTQFVARYQLYQQTRPDYFKDNAWPLRLAEEIGQTPQTR